MVGFADTDSLPQKYLECMDEYVSITRKYGTIQCICDESGRLYAIDNGKAILHMDPSKDRIEDYYDAIGPLLSNAKGSFVRTVLQPRPKLLALLPGKPFDSIEKKATEIYPIFQGKIHSDAYNVSMRLPDEITQNLRSTQQPTAAATAVDHDHPLARAHRCTPPLSTAYCIVDARTGLFLHANEAFQRKTGTDSLLLMRSRCEELGMKDLLLLSTLNANRKCFFQSHFRPNENKQWFLSETLLIDERECVRIWCPENTTFPGAQTPSNTLAMTYCNNWKNKPERVMICDDNDLLVDTCCSIMDWAGIRHDVAKNGKEALQHMEFREYQCIFLDLNMPTLNGFDTARLIRQSKRDYRMTPIIAMTATPLSEADLARQLKHFDAILLKPFDIEDVRISIDKARMNLELKRRVIESYPESDCSHSQPLMHSHSDYEPTPFMVQFSSRTEILEDLREHILSTLKDNIAYAQTLVRDQHLRQLQSLAQQTQSMATSIGAWKLATHSGRLLDSLVKAEKETREDSKKAFITCMEEAICFYNMVDWKSFVLSETFPLANAT